MTSTKSHHSGRASRVALATLGLALAGCTSIFESPVPIVAAKFSAQPGATAVAGPDTVVALSVNAYTILSEPSCEAHPADRLEQRIGDIVVRARVRMRSDCPNLVRYNPITHRVATQWETPGTYEVRFIGECDGVECAFSKSVVVIPAP
jgi:hypothetical protein